MRDSKETGGQSRIRMKVKNQNQGDSKETEWETVKKQGDSQESEWKLRIKIREAVRKQNERQ